MTPNANRKTPVLAPAIPLKILFLGEMAMALQAIVFLLR